MHDWLYIVIQGVLIGGFYAILAAGLSMAFGVMRVINLAHGDVVVLGAFVALVCVQTLTGAIGVLPASLLALPLMFALGYGFQRVVLNRTVGAAVLPPLLVTFGLSVILQNALLQTFTADSRRLPVGVLDGLSVTLLPGVQVGLLQVLVFGAALALFGGLHLLVTRTATGRALRAASDDPHTLAQVGLDPKHVFAFAMGLSFAICALAALAFAATSQFTPLSGPPRLLIAFEAVVIGGVGSLLGTLLGALLLGVVQSVAATYDPALQQVAGHLLFLLVLLLRPQGLFTR
jgi:branched-chain amino acid transport system permease protein